MKDKAAAALFPQVDARSARVVVGPTWTHKIWKNYGGYTSENMMHGDIWPFIVDLPIKNGDFP